jgi:hypothetical protein
MSRALTQVQNHQLNSPLAVALQIRPGEDLAPRAALFEEAAAAEP